MPGAKKCCQQWKKIYQRYNHFEINVNLEVLKFLLFSIVSKGRWQNYPWTASPTEVIVWWNSRSNPEWWGQKESETRRHHHWWLIEWQLILHSPMIFQYSWRSLNHFITFYSVIFVIFSNCKCQQQPNRIQSFSYI